MKKTVDNGDNVVVQDIIHYQKIVVALTETDRLMKEIDEVFVFGEEVIAND